MSFLNGWKVQIPFLPIASSIISTKSMLAAGFALFKKLYDAKPLFNLTIMLRHWKQIWALVVFSLWQTDLCLTRRCVSANLISGHLSIYPSLQKAIRVRTPKREFDKLLTEHTIRMSAYWITLRCPRNCTEGPKSTELGSNGCYI